MEAINQLPQLRKLVRRDARGKLATGGVEERRPSLVDLGCLFDRDLAPERIKRSISVHTSMGKELFFTGVIAVDSNFADMDRSDHSETRIVNILQFQAFGASFGRSDGLFRRAVPGF